jgi:putative ABC transport system permease protein
VRFPTARYPDDAHTLAAIEDIERRLRALPGIDAVGATTTLPLNGYFWTGDATVEGRAGDDYERELRHEVVTPGYFQTIGVPLVRGRFLTDADRPPHAPVTLVNETLAKKYFGGADPVGRRIKFGRPQDKDEWTTIVGIVGDVKQDAMDVAVQPEVYEPLAQNSQNRVSFVVRSALPPDALMTAVRPQVHAVDKDLALTDAGRLGEVLHNATADQRFRTSVLTAFAIVALFLAALGIYGVVAYFVAHRSRELGIRLALGASVADVFGIVLRQGMLPVIAGALAGLAVASAAAGLIRSLLFGIEPLDPMTYGSAVLTLCVVAVAACALPAARAVRIDPAGALRDE